MTTVRPGVAVGPSPAGARPLPMIMSSVSVIAGKVATMGLGFLFWLMAARMFDQEQVGLAAGAVAAMMLCTQLAIFGVGSALITRYPEHIRQPRPLMNNAITLASAAALVVAVVALILAFASLQQLSVIARSPVFALCFILACLTGTLGILLDQASIAIRRGDQVLYRGLAFGLVTVASLAAIAWGTSAADAMYIFIPWVAAGAVACLAGAWQLGRALGGYRYQPSVQREAWRDLVAVGLPNWALTMTERAPGLLLPVVVTEVLSPKDNAVWYAAWMMAWVLLTIPISVGLTLFAEATHRPDKLRRAVRVGLGCSLGIGIAGALLVAALAPYVLSLLGDAYADDGTTPLRILLLSVVPLAFTQAYFAICRSRRGLRSAIVVGVVSALVSVIAAAIAGRTNGLEGIAVAWTITQTVTGLFCLQRIAQIWREAPDSGRADATPRPPSAPAAWLERLPDLRARGPGTRIQVETGMRLPLAAPRLLASAAPLAAVALAVGLWAVILQDARLDRLSDLGIVSALPPVILVPFAMLFASFAVCIHRAPRSTVLLLVHTVALIVMLYGVRGMIEQIPAFKVTWRHIGIAEVIDRTGTIDPTIDAYFNWPGFFTLFAFLARIAGYTSIESFASWAPVFFNLLYLAPLLVIMRTLTKDARVVWLSVWGFFLLDWIAQDYLAPQAMAFFLHLVVLAIVLKWFTLRDNDLLPAMSTSAAPVALVGVVLLIMAYMIPSHQLTPFASVVALGGLLAVRRLVPRGLATITGIMTGAWLVLMASDYLTGHQKNVTGGVGDIQGTVTANVSARIKGSAERLFVVDLRLLLTAVVWVLAIFGAWRLFRKGRLDRAVGALAVSPLFLMGLQSYGGEVLLRVFLFTLPFAAYLVVSLLLPTPRTGRSRAAPFVMFAVSMVTLMAFAITRYGNERMDYFTQNEVSAVRWVYANAFINPSAVDPDRRKQLVMISGSDNLPWKSALYEKCICKTIVGLPEWEKMQGASPDPAPAIDRARQLMRPYRADAYMIFTRSQRAEIDLIGDSPRGSLAKLEAAVAGSPYFRRVYRNPDAEIFVLSDRGLEKPAT